MPPISHRRATRRPRGPERAVGPTQEGTTGMTDYRTPDTLPASLASLTDATLVALVDPSPDFIGIASPAGQVLFVNPAGQQLVGLDGPEQVRATVLLDYIAAEDRERFQTEIWPSVMQH